MKWFIVGFLFTASVFAETSKILPVVLEASRLYVLGERVSDNLYVRPDIRAALEVLEVSKVDPQLLAKRTANKNHLWQLRADDKYDRWVRENRSTVTDDPREEVPEIAVQAFRVDADDISDDWLKDDVYAYFFITDGVIPTGKVTSIYRGLSNGQSFFFNEIDRAIFPLIGVQAKRPENHLIIDYGLMESDGDDIKELQKLSSIIIDIAIAVYSSYDPQHAQVIVNLRKEIKALTEMLLGLDHDDRLATSTVAWKVSELEELLRNESYVEITKKFHSGAEFSKWQYRISFRLLRN